MLLINGAKVRQRDFVYFCRIMCSPRLGELMDLMIEAGGLVSEPYHGSYPIQDAILNQVGPSRLSLSSWLINVRGTERSRTRAC